MGAAFYLCHIVYWHRRQTEYFSDLDIMFVINYNEWYEIFWQQLAAVESTTEDVLPTAAEEIQPAKDNDSALLHSHHWVHPHLLYHHLVRCCHCQGEEQPAAYHPHSWKGDKATICLPSRTCTPRGPWSEQGRLWTIHPTLDTLCFSHSPLAEGCGPSGAKPHATRTVSFHLPLASSTRPRVHTDFKPQTLNHCYVIISLFWTHKKRSIAQYKTKDRQIQNKTHITPLRFLQTCHICTKHPICIFLYCTL